VDCAKLAADQFWFMVIFAAKVGLGLVVFAFKPVLGVLFLGAYALYVWREIRSSGAEPEDTEELEPLKFRPRDATPARHWALLQSGLALLVITVASKVFVGQLEQIGHFFGLSAQLVALLLSPVATELPEAMNALIWVRQGRERLALANISGSMMIQGTIPTALGLFFTPWHLDPPLVMSAVYTGAATLLLFLQFRRGRISGWQLLPAGLLYVAFAATLPFLHTAQ
jgi:cation:H+ antiporter